MAEKVLYGPVWHPLPQTSQCAEWVAWAVAHQVARRQTRIWSDCLNVVKGHQKPLHTLLSPNHIYGGVVRGTLSDEGSKWVEGCWKVKAHALGKVHKSLEDKHKAQANDWADSFAKLGARLHPSSSTDEARELLVDFADVEKVGKLVVALWGLWPQLPKGW